MKRKEFGMTKKILILPVLLLILAAGITSVVRGVVLPWLTFRREQSIARVETPVSNPSDSGSCTGPVILTPGNDKRIAYKGISFLLDPTLAESVRVQECPTVSFRLESEPGTAHPSYIGFTFPTDRQRIDYQTELRIYSVDGDMQSFLYPINSLNDLRNVATKKLEPITWFDGAPLHVQRRYLSFAKGNGVRGIVEYAQDIFFFTNNGLLYEYDGLTDDNHLYVNLRYPVAAPFLMDIEHSDPSTNINPQAITIPEWNNDYEQRANIVDAYNKEALNRLEAMKTSDFTPNIQALDALIESLKFE
jgi:hypothetical protein